MSREATFLTKASLFISLTQSPLRFQERLRKRARLRQMPPFVPPPLRYSRFSTAACRSGSLLLGSFDERGNKVRQAQQVELHPTAFALLERIGDRERQVPIRAEAFK